MGKITKIGKNTGSNGRIKSKLIEVENWGVVRNTSKGAPIRTNQFSYRENINNIMNMIARDGDHCKIYELITDSRGNLIGKVELTMENFDKDNKSNYINNHAVAETEKNLSKEEDISPLERVQQNNQKNTNNNNRKKNQQNKKDNNQQGYIKSTPSDSKSTLEEDNLEEV